jgi:uncharacterized protein
MKLFQSSYIYQHKLNHKFTLINNFLTGALDIVESDKWNDIIEGKKKLIGTEPLSELTERGYFYPDAREEDLLFKELYSSYTKKSLSHPLRFVFCPSYVCNLACIYCFEKGLSGNPNKYMTIEQLNIATDTAEKIAAMSGKEIKSIELFGGEPLLKKTKPLIKKLIDFSQKHDATVTVVTNGVDAKYFADMFLPIKKNIDLFQITIDGPKEIHDTRRRYPSAKGSFEDICGSIDILLAKGINVNVRINIDINNLFNLPQFYEFISKKQWFDYKNFSVKPSIVMDHSTLEYKDPIVFEEILLEKLIGVYDKYPELEEQFGYYMFKPLRHILDILNGAPNVPPRFYNCESNSVELNVFCPDGYIYACGESIGHTEYAIGKFYPDLVFFEDRINNWKMRNIIKMEECRKCTYGPICGGGCAYSSILVHGTYNKPVCGRYKPVLDTFFRLRGEKILNKFIGIK